MNLTKNSNDNDVMKSENRRYSRNIKIALIIASSIIAILLSFIIFVWLCITGGFPTKTSNINDYGKFKDFKGYSNLYIFPKEIPDSAHIDSYYYYYRDTMFDPTCQIYLEYSLSKEDFDAEVSRLSNISQTFKNEHFKNAENTIVYDTTNFNYPAYVTIFNDNYCYEYALIDEENSKIICVFTQFILKPEDIKFDKKYLPIDFNNGKSFSMYYTNGYFERDER
ncbi:MAG TPA: hypothetical protein DG753_03945 [Clostridium sp.]|nr:hypothetical protein [Clostridium sp.]